MMAADLLSSPMIWLVMIISGLLTFAARFSMIGLFRDRELPKLFQQLLTYVAPSVLAAIIIPDVLLIDGAVMVLDNPKIPAFVLAMIAATLTRNVLLTISTGMIALWVITAVF